MSLEKRSTTKAPDLRDNGDGPPTITGYAAVYYRSNDSSTEYRLWPGAVERIKRGAFDGVVGTADVRALFNHDPNQLLGRTKAGTLKLSVDDYGLRYEVTPSDTTSYRDVVELLKRGDIDGSSFQFAARDSWEAVDGKEIRTIEEVTTLLDVGPVTFPAYTGTTSNARSEFAEARSARDAWAERTDRITAAEKESRLRKIGDKVLTQEQT